MSKIFNVLLRLSFLGIFAATLPDSAHAQAISVRDVNTYLKKREDGKNVSLFHRFELSYGLTYGKGNVTVYSRFRDPSNYNIATGRSRTTTFNYRSTSGYSAVYLPVSYFTTNTALVLNIGAYGTANVWDIGNTSLDDRKVTTYESKDMIIGLPIGLDFIYGGEATLNKIDKVTLRGGAGLMPYFAAGQLADGSQNYTKLGVKPYIKGEIGFFAGVEWKLRGMVIAGSRTIYDYKEGDYNLQTADSYYAMDFKIKPTYTVGIAVFPFSFGWENDKW